VRVHLAEVPDTESPDLKVCVYRVLQEGLANAQRHGLADSTTVLAEVRGEWLTLEISNDVGREEAEGPQPAHRPPQLGLAGMRARLEAVGGRLAFDQSGSKARLVVDVPLGGSGEAS